eukprot:scaffold13222_cov122-Isochrysis_galbana.AAC.2
MNKVRVWGSAPGEVRRLPPAACPPAPGCAAASRPDCADHPCGRLMQRRHGHVRGGAGAGHLPRSVLRVGLEAELGGGAVRFAALQVLIQPPAPGTDAQHQDALCHRVESASVTDLEPRAPSEDVAGSAELALQAAARLGHHVEAGPVLRLVRYHDPVGSRRQLGGRRRRRPHVGGTRVVPRRGERGLAREGRAGTARPGLVGGRTERAHPGGRSNAEGAQRRGSRQEERRVHQAGPSPPGATTGTRLRGGEPWGRDALGNATGTRVQGCRRGGAGAGCGSGLQLAGAWRSPPVND